jgi:protein-tyrosine-phosphatase
MSRGSVYRAVLECGSGLTRVAVGKESVDEFAWDDVDPFFCSIRNLFDRYVTAYVKKVIGYRMDKPQYQYASDLNKQSRVLFLCKGNINRSCFAENYFNKLFCGVLESASAGTLIKRNRLASRYACDSARPYTVDLTQHRSQSLYDVNVFSFSHIFVFDSDNLTFVQREFPEIKNRVYLLDPDSEIEDPHGQNIEVFHNVFERIASRVEILKSKFSMAEFEK